MPVDGVLCGLSGDRIGLRLAGERAVGRRRRLGPAFSFDSDGARLGGGGLGLGLDLRLRRRRGRRLDDAILLSAFVRREVFSEIKLESDVISGIRCSSVCVGRPSSDAMRIFLGEARVGSDRDRRGDAVLGRRGAESGKRLGARREGGEVAIGADIDHVADHLHGEAVGAGRRDVGKAEAAGDPAGFRQLAIERPEPRVELAHDAVDPRLMAAFPAGRRARS